MLHSEGFSSLLLTCYSRLGSSSHPWSYMLGCWVMASPEDSDQDSPKSSGTVGLGQGSIVLKFIHLWMSFLPITGREVVSGQRLGCWLKTTGYHVRLKRWSRAALPDELNRNLWGGDHKSLRV